VFDRLSDAVLADAVELYTNPAPVPPPVAQPSTLPENSANNVNDSSTHGPGSTAFPQYLPEDYLNPGFLAVDNALRDSLPDLQHIYDTSWADDAILQLSMDWLEGIGPNSNPYDTIT
jgi:hypothetical protein